jgi:hypothetical protein
MSVRTQGTQLYAIDPADGSVITIGCPTTIEGIDASVEQVEVTCLDSLAREYVAGMPTPGSASFGINYDPADQSHLDIEALYLAGTSTKFAIGWSDGTGIPPTTALDTDGDWDFVLPTTRTWTTFEGFINSFPLSFALNAVVQSTVGIQVSGARETTPKVS